MVGNGKNQYLGKGFVDLNCIFTNLEEKKGLVIFWQNFGNSAIVI